MPLLLSETNDICTVRCVLFYNAWYFFYFIKTTAYDYSAKKSNTVTIHHFRKL